MRRGLLCALAIAAVSVAAPRGARWNFIPDWTFKGNDLKKDWTVLGQATWQAANGELIGTPTSPEGGWLVLNKGLQDFQFGTDLKCSAECKAGVLVRARRQPDGGLTGIFVPYGVGETGPTATASRISSSASVCGRITRASSTPTRMARPCSTPT